MAGSSGESYVIGLDLGTTGAKAGLVGPAGEVLATCAVGYETATPVPGWAEQDPSDWWRASASAVRSLVKSSGVEPGLVRGIGISGQMHGAVFLDSRGRPVRPCILWCDQRSAAQCGEIAFAVGADGLRLLVGNPALPGFTAPKVLWLRDNEPESYAAVRALLLPKDYVNYRLTGRLATDVSDASGTLLFDVASRRWSQEMLEALGIPPGWLPPVHESAEAVGVLTEEAAQETGLAPGTTVAAGGADNACGALGMGVTSPGRVAVSVGSSGTVLSPTVEPHPDPGMRLHLFCHALPGTWYLMGVMLSAGLSLRWFRDELGEPERTEAARLGGDAYDLLVKTASGAPAGCEGLLFLPYLSGERTPHADPLARGVIFGLDLTKRRSHVIRSVLEGVTYGLKDSLGLMSELGVPLASVVSGGGGSRSAFWRQMQADVFEVPVTAAATSDTAMLGAALLASVAAGVHRSVEQACSEWVKSGETLEPDPSTFEAYRGSYRLFRALYPALRELYQGV